MRQAFTFQEGSKMKKAIAMMLMSAAAAGFAGRAGAASSEAKLAYEAAMDMAAADFKVARAACDSLAGNPKDVCVAEAKASRIHVEAKARAQYKNNLSASIEARKVIADAEYDVDKLKCASQTGNARDVCIQLAKSTRIAAVADAAADKKVIEARTEAREDKQAAAYKVALEKCAAFAGPVKDACISDAKTQFGK